MDITTFVYQNNGKHTFYVTKWMDDTHVVGYVKDAKLHTFTNAIFVSKSVDKLIAKVKHKFGVGEVINHPVGFSIAKDGKDIIISAYSKVMGTMDAEDYVMRLLAP